VTGGKYQAVKNIFTGSEPFFHLSEFIWTLSREGWVPDLSTDSTTSPEKMAFLGTTVPLTRLAMVSFASIFVPGGVFPALTFC
jgi:hypothetical protein